MGQLVVSDNAVTTLAGALSSSPSVNSAVLVDGSKFPVVNQGGVGTDWSYITFYDASNNYERVKVTRHDAGSNTVSIARGTSAGIAGNSDSDCKAWASSTTGVACRLIAQTINDIGAAATSAAASASTASSAASTAVTEVAKAPLYTTSAAAFIRTNAGGTAWVFENAAAHLAALGGRGITDDVPISPGKAIIFEGATDDANETTITVVDPTADRTITFPDASGTTMLAEVETDITGAMTHTEATLTDAANIDWNLDTQQNAKVTLGGNRVMNAPTNAKAGRYVALRVIQDGTGGRSLTFNAAYKGMSGITPTTTAGAVNFYLFRCIDTTNLALVGFRANTEA